MTRQTIGNSILSLSEKNETGVAKYRAQAHDGASAMSRNSFGVAYVIKKNPTSC